MTSARDLTSRLAALLRNERAALADFLVALAVFDRERRWLELGYGSLFDFLHRELGLSKASAFYRKRAAELVQRFPEVVEPIRDGRLCLTSVVEVAKVLTEENRSEVLPRFFQLSKREAKAVSAEIRPDEAPPRRSLVTTVRVPVVAPIAAPTGGSPASATVMPHEAPFSLSVVRPDEPARANSEPDATTDPSGTPSSRLEPLTAELNRLHITVSRPFLAKLEAARAALSHSHPGASAQEILEAALDLLLAQHAKRKGLTHKPRRDPPPTSRREHVPAHVKRAVWKRDGARCQWPTEGGEVCGSTHRLQFDHVHPLGKGGASTIENVRLLCDVHNQLAARQAYGDWMERFTRGRAPFAAPATPAPPR
jgi:hypothetical protein